MLLSVGDRPPIATSLWTADQLFTLEHTDLLLNRCNTLSGERWIEQLIFQLLDSLFVSHTIPSCDVAGLPPLPMSGGESIDLLVLDGDAFTSWSDTSDDLPTQRVIVSIVQEDESVTHRVEPISSGCHRSRSNEDRYASLSEERNLVLLDSCRAVASE